MGLLYDTISAGRSYIVSGNRLTIPGPCTTNSCASGIEFNSTGLDLAWAVNNVIELTGTTSEMDDRGLWCDVSSEGIQFINNYVKGSFSNPYKNEFRCKNNTFKYNIFKSGSRVIFGTPAPAAGEQDVGGHHLYNTHYGASATAQQYTTVGASDIEFVGNIVFNGYLAIGTTTRTPALQYQGGNRFNYNLYCPATGCTTSTAMANLYGDTGTPGAPTQTLAQWRTTMSDEAQSVLGDPLFTNPATDNFSLQAGSPALGTGEAGRNMGACPGNSLQSPLHTGNAYLCGTYSAVPSIALTPTPATQTRGRDVVLDWASGTATACTPTTWTTSSGSYGKAVVRPTTLGTQQYQLTCTNPQGPATATATVTVTPPLTTPSPVAWWKFENNTTDSSGNGLTCTAAGSPTYAAGQFGQGIVLNGTNQNCTVTNTALVNPTAQLSFTAWVKFAASTAIERIVSKDLPTPELPNKTQYFLASFWDSGVSKRYLRWHLTSQFVTRRLVSPPILVVGQWHHVAATYDGTTVALYVDGVLQDSGPFSGPIVDAGTNFALGSNVGGGNWFNGTLDDVKFYAVGLSQAEIQAIMTTQNVPPAATITAPTGVPTYSTGSGDVALGGSALGGAPAGSITSVTWDCATCTPVTGSATGTTSWSIPSIGLALGANLVTVTATDSSGQIATAQLTVTQTGTPPPPVLYAPTQLRVVP
jgi:hypothetical protein